MARCLQCREKVRVSVSKEGSEVKKEGICSKETRERGAVPWESKTQNLVCVSPPCHGGKL